MQSFEDMGYKSDGEGYQHQPHQNQQAGQGSHNNSRGAKCYNPNRSCENVMYNNGGKSSNSSQQFHSMRNGYASDGEGYAIRNRRVSRSGKYGSHGSSPVAHHIHHGQGGQDNKHHHHHHRSQQHQQQVHNTFIFYLFTIDLTEVRMVGSQQITRLDSTSKAIACFVNQRSVHSRHTNPKDLVSVSQNF